MTPHNDSLISDALYDWVTKGANVGAQADLGLGPLTLTSNAGFETLRADDDLLGDYWYEPLPEGEVIVQPVETVEVQPEDGGSQYFGLQVRGHHYLY